MTDTNEDVNFNESIQYLYNLYLKLEMLTSISDQLSDENAEKVNKLFNVLDAIPILRMIKLAHEKHNQEQNSDDDEEEQQEENQEQQQEQQQQEEKKKTTKQKKPSARQSTEKKAPKEKKAPAEKKLKNCQFENCESQVAPGKYKFCEQHSKNKKK